MAKLNKKVKIVLNEKWCKKCRICIEFCPTAVFEADPYGLPIISKPEECINCKLCEIRCPDFAMEVIEQE